MDGDTAALEPFVAFRFGLASSREGLFYEIEALIQSVAANHAVVREGPDTVNGIVRPDHVRAPYREWVNLQPASQFVDCGLDGERRLGRAVSPESAGWHGIRVNRVTRALFVGAA